MKVYTPPTLTHVGSFKSLTKSLGRLRCRDIFNARALWTVTPGC
ncbi:lasso RiPP family leader peptide-containing protein [Actinomyces acetigenes]